VSSIASRMYKPGAFPFFFINAASTRYKTQRWPPRSQTPPREFPLLLFKFAGTPNLEEDRHFILTKSRWSRF